MRTIVGVLTMTLNRCWIALLCAQMLAACGPSPGTPIPAASVDARAVSEQRSAEIRAGLCSARGAKAAGLQAEYFAQPALKGKPLLVRLEGPIDDAWPEAGREVDGPVMSARWRGWIRAPVSGRYAFHTDVPGAMVRVAGQQLGSASPGQPDVAEAVELAAGRYHPITVEVPRIPGASAGATRVTSPGLRLSWTAPHGARYLIPKAVLFPPSETVVDAVAAPVARTR